MENTKEAEAVDDLFDQTPIGILRSMQAYMRALPELLANPKYERQWVAYHGNECIGIADRGIELIRVCVKRGFKADDWYIGIIAPQDPDEWTGLFLPRNEPIQ